MQWPDGSMGTVMHWIAAAGILIVGGLAIKILIVIIRKTLRRTSLDRALHRFILSGVSGVLWVVLIGIFLHFMGASVATFVAVIGAAGAAIALALKDSLANVAGGIIILLTKPFKRDDFIEVGDASGIVDHIDLLFTTLKTMDNKVVRIPNGILSNSVMVNYSEAALRRVDCKFNISRESSISRAKEILSVIAEQCGLIAEDPAPIIGVSEHLPSSIVLDMKVWCATEQYWDVKYFLEENVKLAFDEAGIVIPYPQMDVHTKK